MARSCSILIHSFQRHPPQNIHVENQRRCIYTPTKLHSCSISLYTANKTKSIWYLSIVSFRCKCVPYLHYKFLSSYINPPTLSFIELTILLALGQYFGWRWILSPPNWTPYPRGPCNWASLGWSYLPYHCSCPTFHGTWNTLSYSTQASRIP